MYASRLPLASRRDSAVVTWGLAPRTLTWTLRVGAFLCFVGHGAFGIMTKAGWLPYFAVAHIGPATAYRLMPLIGILDITIGCLVLVKPRPALIYWMILWAAWTALLRPLAGESGWEAIERAGNYGVPIALAMLLARPSGAALFGPARFRELSPDWMRRLRVALTLVVAALLVGHGALSLEGKPGITANFAALVSTDAATALTTVCGAIEVAAALVLLRWQPPAFAFAIAVWKLATESLFVVSGQSPWELVERGGSYAAPVALAIVVVLARRRPRA